MAFKTSKEQVGTAFFGILKIIADGTNSHTTKSKPILLNM